MTPLALAGGVFFRCHLDRASFLTNLSLDVNIPSLADSFHSTALSGSTHLGQKIGDGFRYQTLSLARTFTTGEIRYRRRKLL